MGSATLGFKLTNAVCCASETTSSEEFRDRGVNGSDVWACGLPPLDKRWAFVEAPPDGSPPRRFQFGQSYDSTVYRSPRVQADKVWLVTLYRYGNCECMKKTLHIDEVTLRDAKKACGAGTDTETVRLGLEALIRHAAYERLRKLGGSDADAKDVPRRRPESRKKRTAA
jgi:hypothetical protein